MWPKERDLDRYNALLGFKIQNFLDAGGLWIDLGVGEGAKPMQPLLGKRKIKLKAICPVHRRLPPGIGLTIGTVPDHAGFLAENRGCSRLVTDVFGAASYSKNPLEALIYGALLLAEGGLFAAFTELRRVGDLETWDRITKFFHNRMGQEILFQTAFMMGDSSKKYSTYVRIHIRGRATTETDLTSLLKDARKAVGVPRKGNPLWISPDRSARIWKVSYKSKLS